MGKYKDFAMAPTVHRFRAMDLKYALRSLAKNPGFTILAVMVMGLGIGANTAVFSVVNSVLLKPLGFHDPDRIVTLTTFFKNTGNGYQVSAPDFHDWHDQTDSFSAMAYYSNQETAVTAGAAAEYVQVATVTPEFPGVFDVHPALGRFFSAEEVKPGSSAAAVISYGFWQSHYAGSPAVLGQSLHVYAKPLTIVGVLPPGFNFPDKADIWFPANTIINETTSRSAHNYIAIGRLKPGVSLEQAQSQLASVAARLEQQWPDSNRNKSAKVTPMRDQMVGDLRTTLYLLLGAVALVLLIACGNVANLLLAKATSRGREIAIRVAVGAGRGDIIRMLVTESLVLAIASGLCGLFFADFGSKALVALAPANIPRLDETAIDGGVLAFTFGISLLASLIFGLAPALQASRVDLNDALKQGATRTMGGGGGRMRAALVVAEIALSVILLAGAGLLVKSFLALQNVTLGFSPEKVLVMGTSVPAGNLAGAQRATRFYKELLPQIAAIPGVTAAGATRVPPGRIMSNGGYWLDRLPERFSVSAPQAVFSIITPGAIGALRIPVKAGRDFNDSDGYEAPFTAIINEALARKSFAGQDPIGRMILCGFDSPKPMRIVGIVGDVRQAGPANDPRPEIYMPYEQHPGGATNMRLIVRTAGEPLALSETLRRKAADLSHDVPVKFTTMEASLAENVATPRFRTLLFGIFACLAVCLAMAGVYGVMAYMVGQRVNEIGLRMALGASPGNVMGLVLRQGLKLVAIGVTIGLAGAIMATRLLTKLLFQVKPSDPLTYVAVAALLGVVALFASYIPARRAMKVDPLIALRQE